MITQIVSKAETLEKRITSKIWLGLGVEFSDIDTDGYVKTFSRYPQLLSYNSLLEKTQTIYEQVLVKIGPEATELWHQLVLIRLILFNVKKIERQYPKCIERLFYQNFMRILAAIEKERWRSGFYLFPNDNFFKDLGVCTLRLIPAGNHKVEISAFSRSFMVKGGLGQFLDAFVQVALRARGNSLFYQFHTDIHDQDALKECNLKGTVKLYLRIAHLLKKQTDIKGLFGSSWMNDPALETISPRIFSGPMLVRENGGRLYFNGIPPNIAEGATFASPKRKRLYREGKYKPANYMLLWLRDDLLAWANRQEPMDL